jgi:hypothetical protein
MTTQKQRPGHVDVQRVEIRRLPPPNANDYEWPRSAALELWALRVQLDAACRKGEARQGWIPCRVIRRVMGVPA